jgi:predicted metal-dependent hydrolase
MDEREQRAAFARGLRQFNSCQFWHAQESWEALWLTAPEPDKTFLQGIIQIAAAFYHHQRGNLEGMRSLMRRGLAKVEGIPPGYRGVRLEELRGAVRKWLAASEAWEEVLPGKYPRLGRAGAKRTTKGQGRR